MIFGQVNPDEAPSIKLPLNSNIPPAKVQTKAASKSKIRLETVRFKDLSIFICFINELAI